MRIVFADSSYWIALTSPRDPWTIAAVEARNNLGDVQIYTTEEVLTEFLDYFSERGQFLRNNAAAFLRKILEAEYVTVLVQSHETFSEGLELYEKRADKAYSHTDCVSMCAMTREGIDEILSSDRHFTQEGFRVLMRQ